MPRIDRCHRGHKGCAQRRLRHTKLRRLRHALQLACGSRGAAAPFCQLHVSKRLRWHATLGRYDVPEEVTFVEARNRKLAGAMSALLLLVSGCASQATAKDTSSPPPSATASAPSMAASTSGGATPRSISASAPSFAFGLPAPAITVQTEAAASMSAPDNFGVTTVWTDAAFASTDNGWVSGITCSGTGTKPDTGGFIETTTNGGSSWATQYEGADAVLALTFESLQNGWAIAVPADTLSSCTAPTSGQRQDALLLQTTDGGQHWTVVDPNAGNISALYFTSPNVGWEGQASCVGNTCTGALLQTTDGGSHWTAVPSADPTPTGFAGGLPVLALTGLDGTIWALEAGPTGAQHGVARIVEGGAEKGTSWMSVGSLPLTERAAVQTAGANGTLTFASPTEGWATIADLGSCTMAACAVNGVYQTTDGGSKWTAVAQRSCNVGTPAVATSGGQVLVARVINQAACGGPATTFLVPTPNGATWSTTGQWGTLQPVALVGAVKSGQPPVFWGVTTKALLRSTDDGAEWSQVLPAPVPTDGIDFLSPSLGWGIGMVSDPGAILKTTDGGHAWSVVASVPDAALSAITFVGSVDGWVAGSVPAWQDGPGSGVLWGTRDGGSSWTPLVSVSLASCVSDGTCAAPESPIPPAVALHFTNGLDGTLLRLGADVNSSCNSIQCQKQSVLTTTNGGATWSATGALPMDSQLEAASMAPNGTVWGIWLGSANCPSILGRGTIGESTWRALHCLTDAYTGIRALQFLSAQDGFMLGLETLEHDGSGIHEKVTASQPVLLHTTDAGSRWTAIPLPSLEEDYKRPSLFFLNAAEGWILSNGTLWETGDGGVQWTAMDS